VRRCLIAWDYEASGIWMIRSGTPSPSTPPLRDLLPSELLDELKRWNDWGVQLFNGRVVEPDAAQVVRWRAAKLDLATRVQDELGDRWEVLYEEGGAWSWVPGGRA
jgi:hypothetical protein